jgi:hypothetical protein
MTIIEFPIETADRNHYFDSVLSLGFGREVSLSANELEFSRSVCGELWNSELQGVSQFFQRVLICRV